MPTVLIVDDDMDVLEAISEGLRQEGFTVRQARGGRAALDVLRTEARPGVVLLDVRMEAVDGMSVSAWIRENPALRDLPVVFMTGDRRFRPADGALVLEKPFGLSELVQTVRRSLGPP